jgi:hypothetical protein
MVMLLLASCTPQDDDDDPSVESLEGRLVIESDPSVSGEIWVAGVDVFEGPDEELTLAPGDYRVCFGPVEGFSTPACEVAVVEADETTTLVVTREATDQDPADEPGQEPDQESSDGRITHGTDIERDDVGAAEDDDVLDASGPIETTEDGQVIENLEVVAPGDISAAIKIQHDDVTVRNVKVTSPGSTSAIRIETDVTGTLIEYVTIDGTRAEYGNAREDANWGNVGIKAYSPIVARRNYIHDVRQGVQMWEGAAGSRVVENYVFEVWQNAPGVSTAGLSYRGSQSSTERTVMARNRVTVSGFAGISAYAQSGPVRNVHMIDNLIEGTTNASSGSQTGYGIRGGYVHGDRDNNRDIRIEGNRFDGDFEWGTNGAVNVDQPGNTFTDNRWIGSTTDEPSERDL